MIQKLPEEIIARVAAGEVITSPFNILKELLENSLDANATRIHVLLSSSLLSLSVSDNGDGIRKDDLKAACLNNCTSKICDISDLQNCGKAAATYGFRGEALHSISQTSKVTITSRCDEDIGYKAIYEGPILYSISKVACNERGTLIEIAEIFHNNSLRKEHYYKNKTELMCCIHLVKSYSIIFTGISLSVDGKEIILPDIPCRNILPMLYTLCDGIWSESSMPEGLKEVVDRKRSYIRSSFLFSGKFDDLKSVLYHKNIKSGESISYTVIFTDTKISFRKYNFILFVNKRMVKKELLKRQIGKVYRSLLGDKKYPLVYIELYIPHVDVNVHPSKAEVMFDEEEVFSEIIGSVEKRLTEDGPGCKGVRIEYPNNGQEESEQIPSLFLPYTSVELSEYGESSRCASEEPLLLQSDTSFVQASKDANAFRRSQQKTISPASSIKLYSDSQQSKLDESSMQSSDDIKKRKVVETQTNNSIIFEYIPYLLSKYKVSDTSAYYEGVFIGSWGNYFFIQHSMSLIKVYKPTFLRSFFRYALLSSLGHLKTTSISSHINVDVDEESYDILKTLGLTIHNNAITTLPVICNLYYTSWEGFCYRKTEEPGSIIDAADKIAGVYSNIRVDHQVYNKIRKDIHVTQEVIDSSEVVTTLRELYRKFGRC